MPKRDSNLSHCVISSHVLSRLRPLSHAQTLALIALPLLATVVVVRIYLHSVEIQHVYIWGHIFYHLFTGVLIVIPAAFVLAFGPSHRLIAQLARVALGVGSGLVLDEVVFLVATNRSAEEYVMPLSLGGSIVFVSSGVILLLVIYWLMRE